MKDKKCETCGKLYTTTNSGQKYCSPECKPKKSHHKKSTKPTKAAPPKGMSPPVTPSEIPAPESFIRETPPEAPAPDTVPPTETTTPLNSGSVPEDKGESEKKPFRKFFYD